MNDCLVLNCLVFTELSLEANRLIEFPRQGLKKLPDPYYSLNFDLKQCFFRGCEPGSDWPHSNQNPQADFLP